jgi:hypothetical protein
MIINNSICPLLSKIIGIKSKEEMIHPIMTNTFNLPILAEIKAHNYWKIFINEYTPCITPISAAEPPSILPKIGMN